MRLADNLETGGDMQHRTYGNTDRDIDDTEPLEFVVARQQDQIQELRAEVWRLERCVKMLEREALPYASNVFYQLLGRGDAENVATQKVDAMGLGGQVRVRM